MKVHSSHPRNWYQVEGIHPWLHSSYRRSWRFPKNAQTWWITRNFRSSCCGKRVPNARMNHHWTNPTKPKLTWWWWTTLSNIEVTNIAKFTVWKVQKRTQNKSQTGSTLWRISTKINSLHQCPTRRKCQISKVWCRFGPRKFKKSCPK